MQTLCNFPVPVLADAERGLPIVGEARESNVVGSIATKSISQGESLADSRGGENLWSGPVFLVFSAGLGPFSAAASEQLVVPRRGGKNPGACCRKSR